MSLVHLRFSSLFTRVDGWLDNRMNDYLREWLSGRMPDQITVWAGWWITDWLSGWRVGGWGVDDWLAECIIWLALSCTFLSPMFYFISCSHWYCDHTSYFHWPSYLPLRFGNSIPIVNCTIILFNFVFLTYALQSHLIHISPASLVTFFINTTTGVL